MVFQFSNRLKAWFMPTGGGDARAGGIRMWIGLMRRMGVMGFGANLSAVPAPEDQTVWLAQVRRFLFANTVGMKFSRAQSGSRFSRWENRRRVAGLCRKRFMI
jgi:hypothetical protein